MIDLILRITMKNCNTNSIFVGIIVVSNVGKSLMTTINICKIKTGLKIRILNRFVCGMGSQ